MMIAADELHYRALNERIHAAIEDGKKEISVVHVCGQRYLGIGCGPGVHLRLEGTPGNDLAVFMNGASVTVAGNAQDGTGNTMNAGRVIIHGNAGDVLGHSMRGGKIFVAGYVGYRAGIHMKAFGEHYPVVIIGESTGDYLGEYMAGGMLIVLNLSNAKVSPVRRHVGTGMHGGVIYIRGRVEPGQLAREVNSCRLDDNDWAALSAAIEEYFTAFPDKSVPLAQADFVKLTPRSARPYERMYAH